MQRQISRLQFIYLMFWTILGIGIVMLPPAIAHFTFRDGWIVPVFFMVGASVAALICTLWVRVFPGRSLVEGFESAFGLWLGKVAGIWFLIWLFVTANLLFRQFILFITTTTLSRTPYFVITGVAMLTAAYGVFQGIESLGRTAEFITPIGILVGLILWVLSMQNLNFSQLQPVLADGFTPVLRGSVVAVATFSFEFILALEFVSSLKNGKTLGKDILITGALLSVFGVVVEATIITVLGSPVTYLSLPLMEVVRGVRIGQFVERLDTLYVMGVIVTMLIEIAVILYVLSTGIGKLVRLPTHRNISWSVGAAVWAGSILAFRDEPTLQAFLIYSSPAYSTFSIVVLPLCAIVVQFLRVRQH